MSNSCHGLLSFMTEAFNLKAARRNGLRLNPASVHASIIKRRPRALSASLHHSRALLICPVYFVTWSRREGDKRSGGAVSDAPSGPRAPSWSMPAHISHGNTCRLLRCKRKKKLSTQSRRSWFCCDTFSFKVSDNYVLHNDANVCEIWSVSLNLRPF